jgi:hypothetical protein
MIGLLMVKIAILSDPPLSNSCTHFALPNGPLTMVAKMAMPPIFSSTPTT